jgi:hypothetical protein
MDVIFQFPNITHLNLRNCIFAQQTVFLEISEVFHDLQYLDMSAGSAQITDSDVKLFLKNYGGDSHFLQTLILSNVKSMTEDTLLQLLNTFPVLTDLEIDNTTDVSEETFTKIITREPKMTKFCFKFLQFSRLYNKENILVGLSVCLKSQFLQEIVEENKCEYIDVLFFSGLDGKTLKDIDNFQLNTSMGLIISLKVITSTLTESEIKINGDVDKIGFFHDIPSHHNFFEYVDKLYYEIFSKSSILEQMKLQRDSLTCLSIQNLQSPLTSTFFDAITPVSFPYLKRIELSNNRQISEQDIRYLELRLAGVVIVCEVTDLEPPEIGMSDRRGYRNTSTYNDQPIRRNRCVIC